MGEAINAHKKMAMGKDPLKLKKGGKVCAKPAKKMTCGGKVKK
jgi:hypothetical protein